MIDSFIFWNPDPVVFHLFSFPVRWYSLCWCVALIAGFLVMQHLYRKQKIDDDVFVPLFMYCFIGVIIGARLGHCLFYEPSYYLHHMVEMLLPIRKIGDSWKLVGYEGLASHGGAIGLFIAVWMYARKMGMSPLRVLDNMGIVAPISAAFIRLGNLVNSEIVGTPTQLPWGMIFAANGEGFPRHPAQLYEAIFYLLFFVVAWLLYRAIGEGSKRPGTGFFFGLCICVIFTFRFFIEFLKADQVAAEETMWLNIGQLLSIPLAAVGIYCMAGGKWCKKFAEKPGAPIWRLPKANKKK